MLIRSPSRAFRAPCCLLLWCVALLGLPVEALAALPCPDGSGPPCPGSDSLGASGTSAEARRAGAALRAALYPAPEELLREPAGKTAPPKDPPPQRRREPGAPLEPAERHRGGLVGALDELLAPDELIGDLGRLVQGDRLLVLGAGAALSGAALGAPDDLAFSALGQGSLDELTTPLAKVGSRVTLYPALLGTFFGAKLADAPGAARTAAQLTQALVLTDLVVTPMKLGVGRTRPDGSNGLSYPSGHTAGAFAVATILHRRYGKDAAIPAYAYAVLMGVARIEGRKHHLSDVIAGAVIGTVTAMTVGERFEGRRIRLQAIAGPGGGAGIGFTLRF